MQPLERFQVAARVMVKRRLWKADEARAHVRETARLPEEEIERRKNWLLTEPLGGSKLTWLGEQLRARGVDFSVR